MTSFSGLGLGLSLVFGCLLFALVAELYYLLWWRKKKIADGEIEDEYGSFAKEFIHYICWKRASPSNLHTNNTQERKEKDPDLNGQESDLELGSSKDLLLKSIGEEGVESELMRLHNLAGPPRFLFTIKEETREDLESEDGKSRGDRSRKGSRTRSLSDLMVAAGETPFLSPLASPRLKSSPLNPFQLDSFKYNGFNPLFESSTEAELSRFRSSPPPKFKFLRDAEEKLYKRLMEEAEKRASQISVSAQNSEAKPSSNPETITEEKEGSFFTFMVGKNNQNLPQFPSSSSQVLPLATSPTAMFKPYENKPIVH
ncbi:hypothetical protein UlMin_013469 [Ulmus minor]